MTRTFHHPATEDLAIDAVLRALGEPHRLAIVEELDAAGEQTCSVLASTLGIPLSTLSNHLRVLREAGVTRSRSERTTRWTSLRSTDLDRRFPGLLKSVLRAQSDA
jgi:DNA-binding transcriptional ArsR family regulator